MDRSGWVRKLKKYHFLRLIPALFPALLGVVSIVILASRANLVEDRFGKITGLEGSFGLAVLKHDAIVVALLLACLLLMASLKSRTAAFLAKSAAFLLTSFYLADFIIFQMSNNRLFWVDIFVYGPDVKEIFFH
jgi:hypothetical protein